MRAHSLWIVVLCCLVLLSSCDGNPDTDNGHLRVQNHTDLPIWVYYQEEVEVDYGVVEIFDQEAYIPPGGERVIYVDTFLWEAEVTVEYDCCFITYDIDFDLSGMETLHVDAEDFAAVPMADG